MTKYADVHKTVITDDISMFFQAREVFSRMDDDYEIEDVDLVSVEILGIEYQAVDLPPKMVDSFLEHFADDDNTEWEYY